MHSQHHVLSHLPYRWVDGYDTRFALDRFTKKTNIGRAPSKTQATTEWNTEGTLRLCAVVINNYLALGIPNPLGDSSQLTPNQISPKKDVDKPNVIVATVKVQFNINSLAAYLLMILSREGLRLFTYTLADHCVAYYYRLCVQLLVKDRTRMSTATRSSTKFFRQSSMTMIQPNVGAVLLLSLAFLL